ncbi:DUF3533 domain-containing protein [Streptomyces flaveolus]|uniref:DUF3533 domain-containing protein n=1 Tax=Streptomyces flaveolus TaxID=67297 RepID=UPI00166FED18|nr:DUF3533 domain-containing protein [Streptomyces flaveolus]
MRQSTLSEMRGAVTPRATLLVIGVIALQLLFVASYVGALHEPRLKDVSFGVVAPVAEQTVSRLEGLPGSPLDPRVLPDEKTARDQIVNRDIYAALVVDSAGTTDALLVASGGGRALSLALGALTAGLDERQGRDVRTVDVAAASPHDFNGLSSFYLVIGWCVGAYLCASILAISAGARLANPARAATRLGTMTLVALLGGLGGAVIVGPVLGALPGSVWALWGLGALLIFAVGAATLALQGLFGVIGIGLAILLIVIAGNPSAGGAFPAPMLPPFWQAIGPALPPGAGTWAARSISYFHGNGMTSALLVLSAWAVAGVLITTLVAVLRQRRAAEAGPYGAEAGGAAGRPGATA